MAVIRLVRDVQVGRRGSPSSLSPCNVSLHPFGGRSYASRPHPHARARGEERQRRALSSGDFIPMQRFPVDDPAHGRPGPRVAVTRAPQLSGPASWRAAPDQPEIENTSATANHARIPFDENSTPTPSIRRCISGGCFENRTALSKVRQRVPPFGSREKGRFVRMGERPITAPGLIGASDPLRTLTCESHIRKVIWLL